MLSTGVAIVEERPKLRSSGLTAEALRLAGTDGASCAGSSSTGRKGSKTVITATSFFRAYRAHQTAPTDAVTDNRIARVTNAIGTAECF
jgi:hypothetical protein